mgnify:CR=1 FL=1
MLKKGKYIFNLRFFDQNGLGSIPRIFVSSIAVLFFFYSMPHIINMNNSTEFKNNSKTVLAYTLNNKTNNYYK